MIVCIVRLSDVMLDGCLQKEAREENNIFASYVLNNLCIILAFYMKHKCRQPVSVYIVAKMPGL